MNYTYDNINYQYQSTYAPRQYQESALAKAWKADLYHPPQRSRPTICLCGNRIASNGNISLLVSESGSGKSAVCEAIAARWLLSNIFQGQETSHDTLAFTTPNAIDKKVLIIDTERSQEDCYDSYCRSLTRAQIIGRSENKGEYWDIKKHHEYDPVIQRTMKMLDFYSFTDLYEMDDRQEAFKELALSGQYGLIILDGLGDMVMDVNNVREAGAIWFFLKSVIKDRISLFTTLHTNPKSDKARGHLGSEAIRRAESVIFIEKDKDGGKSLRPLKVRNAKDRFQVFFDWDDNKHMHMTLEVSDKVIADSKERSNEEEITKLDEFLFPGVAYTNKELQEIIMGRLDLSERTAQNRIKDWTEAGTIIKQDRKYFWKSPF